MSIRSRHHQLSLEEEPTMHQVSRRQFLGIAAGFDKNALVFNQLYIGLGIIAIFANITALQRILHVRKQAHKRALEK